MKAYKLFVANEEESRKVQEKAFRLGYAWKYKEVKDGTVNKTSDPFIYLEDNEIWVGECEFYNGWKFFDGEYITVAYFLALPEPKREFPFKPFDRVIVRESEDSDAWDNDRWYATTFSHLTKKDAPFNCAGFNHSFIAPYEGNEHLVGKTGDATGMWTAEDLAE